MLCTKVLNKVARRIKVFNRAVAPSGVRCMAMTSIRREIAVVGAGVSGLYCAYVLSNQGHAVTVFDMGKHSPGGRLTTRRTTWKGLQFDHGMQFVRPASDIFKAICEEWLAAGALEPWQGRVVRLEANSGTITPRTEYQQQQGADAGFLDVLSAGPLYVGYPSSDAITHHLAAATAAAAAAIVRHDVRVTKAQYDASTNKWLLEGAIRTPTRTISDLKQQPPITPWNLGVFDGLVLADKMTGCPGTPGFIHMSGSTAGSKMLAAMSQVGSTPMLALLMAYQPPEVPPEQQAAAAGQQGQQGPPVLQLPFDAAAVVNSDEIVWICLDGSKPGRCRADGIQSVVALASPSFSESLIQRNPDGSLPPQTPELLTKLVHPMFAAVQRVLAPLLPDGRLQEPAFVQVHRWGSAFPAKPFGTACLTAESAHLAACGDFCLGGGVENAVLSGQAAAEAMSKMLAAAAGSERQ